MVRHLVAQFARIGARNALALAQFMRTAQRLRGVVQSLRVVCAASVMLRNHSVRCIVMSLSQFVLDNVYRLTDRSQPSKEPIFVLTTTEAKAAMRTNK